MIRRGPSSPWVVALVVVAAGTIGCGGARSNALVLSPGIPDPVASTLRRMPADTSARENELAAELVAIPDAVPVLVGMLGSTAASDDALAQYALEEMARWGSRPRAGGELSQLAAALAAQLQVGHGAVTDRFVIEMLQRLEDPAGVAALQGRLGDAEVGDAAARALAVIGGDAASEAIVKALRGAAPGTRPDLMIAAGRLRARAAVSLRRGRGCSGGPAAPKRSIGGPAAP